MISLAWTILLLLKSALPMRPHATGRSRCRRTVTSSTTSIRSALGKPLTRSWPEPLAPRNQAYDSLECLGVDGLSIGKFGVGMEGKLDELPIFRDLVGCGEHH